MDAIRSAGFERKEMNMPLDLARSALLLMDLQAGIVDMLVKDAALLERSARAAAIARARGMLVVYVSVRLRDGDAAASANNRIFSGYGRSGGLSETSAATAIHADAGYLPGQDHLVVKRRVSAFAGSDLELLLRARDIDTLVLAGVATSGVVLSTLRQAADMDYRLFVLGDCCTDADPQAHAFLMEKVFPRQAEVIDLAAFEA
jgi:nicotinamidase-related amidase